MTAEDRNDIVNLLSDHAQHIQDNLDRALQAFATTMNAGLIEAQQLANKQATDVPRERAKLYFAMECYKIRLTEVLKRNEEMSLESISRAVRADVSMIFPESLVLKEKP